MVTNERKERVCKENEVLLEIIWLLGKGVMFKKHIEAYMERFFAKKPKDTWEKVKRLEEAEIVQRIRLHNVIAIKLKKYALRFLLEVDREHIRSIEVTASKLMRSAYVHAVVLHHLKTEFKLFDYKQFMDYYVSGASFFASRNQTHKILSIYFNRRLMNESVVEEIEKLKLIEERSKSFEVQKKTQHDFNINSMEQGSIYFDFYTRSSLIPNIAILDDKNNLSGVKVAEKMMKTYMYLSQFVPQGTLFQFTVYVQNENRLKALTGTASVRAFKNFVENKSRTLGSAFQPQNCGIEFVNLELDDALFGNQSLIFAGNVHTQRQREFEKKITEEILKK